MLFEKNFGETYKSVVVLANPKTCLNAKYAKKEIKQQVIRADQLITYIKEMDALVKDGSMSEKQMAELARFFLDKNMPGASDYARKYEELVARTEGSQQETAQGKVIEDEIIKEKQKDTEELIKKLKEFRKEQSKKEGMKAYYIFSDAQMMDLIEKNPVSKAELLKVSGFGTVKVEKYGDELLSILHS